MLGLVGETDSNFEPLPEWTDQWTAGWAELFLGVVSLSILLGILMWVYHSMQRPRLFLGSKPLAVAVGGPDESGLAIEGPGTVWRTEGEPTLSWEAAVRYLFTTAIALVFWYAAILVILTVATQDRSAESIALGAAVVIGTTRFLAHLNPEAAHEISKTIPLVIVSIILIGGGGGEENFATTTLELFENFDAVDTYYWLLLVVDILITTLWALRVRSRWRAHQLGSRRLEIWRSLAPLVESVRSIRNFGKPKNPYNWRSHERSHER